MGLFNRRSAAPKSEARSFTLGQLGAHVAAAGGSTTVTDSDTALHNGAIWACIDVLATSASQLPLRSVVRSGAGIRVPVEPAPQLLLEPSALVEPDVWVYQIMFALGTDGNCFGRVAGVDRTGRPTGIELLDPSTVTGRGVVNGRGVVRVAGGDPEQLWPHGSIWHVPGKMIRPGSPFGLSPLVYAGRATGTGLAAEDFGSDFFGGGGHPSAIISATDELTETQAKAIKTAYQKATGSSTSREPAVFGAGLKFQEVQSKPVDTQFLDLMRFNVEQICRFYRVPPTMVYGVSSGQAVTYQNASQADLAYLKHSLDGYLSRIEGALSAVLPAGQQAKFNRDALLRADTAGRYDAYAVALEHGILTLDEVRALEDRPPLDADDGTTAEAARSQSVAETIQKVYLGVDKVLTSDEAWLVINDVGGDLSLPGPDFTDGQPHAGQQ